MIGHEIGLRTGEELLRFVHSLGHHRYIASRLHLVHAFAVEAAAAHPGSGQAIAEAAAWAKRALGSGAMDLGSKDERLYTRASDAEVGAVLSAFWGENPEPARRSLRDRLASIDALPDLSVFEGEGPLPFDEAI